jgi:hypothetical protein
MDSYIVRIYRQTGDPSELTGQIEKAGTEIRENFHSSGELVSVLMNSGESDHGQLEVPSNKSENGKRE